eukprot:CAMPEP_0197262740 /NCGR_PEP_ID=MMETSP1432-20130617/674_1 /TAXON_ID=44447 /ORGANISM="Pseudo-nitzschia delicatissima, Strain UNC1205" /LENGTH=176 /DNA_ID=CAMNT_0042727065 /DNA_START=12 /DNA_END=542 /DNA_ORIENTATION=+
MTRNESMDWAETLTSQPIGKILIAANTNDIVDLDDVSDTATRDGTGAGSGLPSEDELQSEDVADIVPAVSVRPADVLMGKGQTLWVRIHPGNVLFRKLVIYSFGQYNSSSIRRAEKSNMSESIVCSIYRQHGRFLKPHGFEGGEVTLWKRLDDVEAHRKVASTFRGIRRQQERNRE